MSEDRAYRDGRLIMDSKQSLADEVLSQRTEIVRLRVALKEIQAQAVAFQPPRYTWFYDRAEQALGHADQQTPPQETKHGT